MKKKHDVASVMICMRMIMRQYFQNRKTINGYANNGKENSKQQRETLQCPRLMERVLEVNGRVEFNAMNSTTVP